MNIKYIIRSISVVAILSAIASQYAIKYDYYLYITTSLLSFISAAIYVSYTSRKSTNRKAEDVFCDKENPLSREQKFSIYSLYDIEDMNHDLKNHDKDPDDEGDLFYRKKQNKKEDIVLH